MADFDPSKLTGDRRTVYVALVAQFGEEGAGRLMESMDRVEGSFRKANEGAAKLEKGIAAVGRIAGTVGGTVNTFTSFINAQNISLKNGLDITIKYRDSVVATFGQFQKYGTSVGEYTARIESLRKTYKLTYDQSISLASGLEKAFNVTGPEKMDGYLKAIRNTVGNNIEAINQFRQGIEGLLANNPLLEKMVGNLDFEGAEKFASGLLSAGKIGLQDYKKFLELQQGQNRPQGQQDELDELQNPAVMIRSAQVAIETGIKKAGDDTLWAIGKTADLVGGVDKWAASLSTVVQRYAEISALVGGIQSIVGGGLNVLDGLADLKSLGAGKLLGRGAGAVRGGAGAALRGGASLYGGAAALGGGGLGGAALTTGGVAAAGAIGFGAGYGIEHYGIEKGLLGGKDLAGKSFNTNYDYKARAESIEDPRKKLMMQLSMLEAQADKEKFDKASGMFGRVRQWTGTDGASEETTGQITAVKNQLATMKQQEAATKILETQKQLSAEDQKALNSKLELVQKQALLIQGLERQKTLLEASTQLMTSQAAVFGRTGQGDLGGSLTAMNAQLAERGKGLRDRMENLQAQGGLDDPEKLAQYKKLEAELLDLNKQRVDAASMYVKQNQPQLDQQKLAVSLMESQVALADSAGTGLRAQVGARQQIVQQLNQELVLLAQQLTRAEEQRAIAVDSGDKYKAFEMESEILRIKQEQTAAVQKQAEVTKSMREGWISAISAMTSGAGVFTRIVIDQNKRLGNLQFAGPDRLKTLRGGGTLGGRRESAQWTPGGFNEGAAGAYEKGVLGQYGLGTNNGLQGMANSVMQYQQNIGSKMSPAAAAAGVGPQGTAELTTAVTEGFVNAMEKANQGKTSGGPKFLLDQNDIDTLKRSWVDMLKDVLKEVKTETIREIQSGR